MEGLHDYSLSLAVHSATCLPCACCLAHLHAERCIHCYMQNAVAICRMLYAIIVQNFAQNAMCRTLYAEHYSTMCRMLCVVWSSVQDCKGVHAGSLFHLPESVLHSQAAVDIAIGATI